MRISPEGSPSADWQREHETERREQQLRHADTLDRMAARIHEANLWHLYHTALDKLIDNDNLSVPFRHGLELAKYGECPECGLPDKPHHLCAAKADLP